MSTFRLYSDNLKAAEDRRGIDLESPPHAQGSLGALSRWLMASDTLAYVRAYVEACILLAPMPDATMTPQQYAQRYIVFRIQVQSPSFVGTLRLDGPFQNYPYNPPEE